MSNSSKKLGLFSMILLCLNGIVGSGLFLLPGQVAAIAGKWSLLIYAFVGILVLSIAWCFAQCATQYNRNGGAYLYAKDAFGNFIGFEIGIMRWVVGMIAWASLTVGFVTALEPLFPFELTSSVKQALIVSLIAGLGVINMIGMKAIKRLNNVITIAKLLPLIIFVIIGIFSFKPSNLLTPETIPLNAKMIGSAALIIFFAFAGFEAFTVAAGEMQNPKKNVPLVVMSAIILCSILYFIIQVICISSLGSSLANSSMPIADIAQNFFGSWGKLLVALMMLISIGGVTIACSFLTPRSCLALAEDGMISQKLLAQNRFGSPYISILISVIITCAIAVSGNFVQLITISVVCRFAQHITTCIALFVFEKKGLMKPFSKAWKRAIPFFSLTGIAWLLTYAEFYQLLWGFGALFLAIPFYFLQKKNFLKQTDRNKSNQEM